MPSKDLNAYEERPRSSRTLQRELRAMPTVSEVRQAADYKNVAFLEKFVSPAGRLLPRRCDHARGLQAPDVEYP